MPKISGVEFMQMDFLKDGAFDEITRALGHMIANARLQAKAAKMNAVKQVADSASIVHQALAALNEQNGDLPQTRFVESKSIPKCDIVLTDMAANTTGNRDADHLRIINLLEESLFLAEKILLVGGSFVGKIFQGGSSDKILQKLRQNFSKVHYFKPNSSRKESSETYLVALGYRNL
jgi:23S rRNA U2552 (ribose-2'-O)-methylase RlmE/FtsJ